MTQDILQGLAEVAPPLHHLVNSYWQLVWIALEDIPFGAGLEGLFDIMSLIVAGSR
ncbi:hypothetical protein [Billgrantia montanilacus]|uniref:hypothetical protein n=1 Tax=Billgrantia montanilacus TaxID=2282305 RepID=UPI0015F0C9E5|nr:hypothetical protein [Halomonas montanilacus]